MQWTTEQKAAISSRHQNLLVSAAAGSGKTALLIERIRRLVVDEDVDVDSLLVLTFTRAAAGEMRERLSTALSEALMACTNADKRRRLSNQLRCLSGASIETIHAFCGDLVREFFQEVGADPNYRIGDDVELDRLQDEAMTAVFEERYLEIPEDGETAFSKLVDAYGDSKGDEDLRTLVLDLWRFLGTLKDPDRWCQKAIDQLKVAPESFEGSAWGEAQKELIRSLIYSACQGIAQIQSLLEGCSGFEKPMSSLQKDLDKLLDLKNHLTDEWQVFQQALQTFKFDSYSGSKEDKETSNKIKDLRTATIKPIKDLAKQFKRPLPEMLEDLQEMAAPMVALIDLTKAFDTEFARLKKEREMLDFHDIERYAQAILANDTIAVTLQKRYIQVFIDEYQDTNEVQEAILARVRRADNYFMVGDVKQSIYRFRQADPTIFIEKYQRFQKQGRAADRLITLGQNFRSNQGIIDCVNDVFSRIMSPELGEIAYDDEAALICGLADSTHPAEPAELHVLQASASNHIEAEARYIAGRIHEMVGKEQWIAKEGVSRPLRYRDIGVLMRSVSSRGETVARILADAGISTYFDAGASYYQSIEIIVVLNLIRVIDNYRQDLPLLSVMRSPIGRFSDEELAAIRIGAKNRPFYQSLEAAAETQTALGQKARMFLDHLERWRKLAYTQSVADFLWRLYLETGYYTAVGALPGGEQRQKNLRVLLQRASDYQTATLHGVFQFPDYAQPLTKRRQGDVMTPSILSENDDVVRIMTIHKSKGLEFPVVFLADCGKGANLKNATGKVKVYFHQKLGICPKWIDPSAKLYHDTLATTLVQEQVKTESLSEEIRLLYVAMTRAMAKLIMIGSVADLEKEKERWEKPCTVGNLKKGRQGSGVSYLDWLMMACYCPGAAQNSVSPALKIKIKEETTREAVTQERPIQQLELSSKQLQEIRRRLSWHYQSAGRPAPSKLSVTQVEHLRENPDRGADALIEIPERVAKPAFMEAAGLRHWQPSELGSGIHTLLQRIDLDGIRACGGDTAQIADAVRAEAARLAELGILEAALVKALDLRPVVRLMGSPIGKRLLRAATCRRELPFNLAVPGRRINPIYGEETVLLQGMIDCCFIEDDRWILLDYKTDRWHSQEARDRLIARYQIQIDFYEQALAAITGRPVAEKYLLFITMGEAVRLSPAEKTI
ncbi:helicase-exonuclease AddAB subunit AddA [Pseudoramibacter alactolyticus]|uniref:helicase-exonuclease AddAB subunit AddA n=1 Tax=Pseudoramibacter alactolyticus TaxID=113287 RepID=UPI0028E32176|nr:helicase-exonuclease AddAB subunit AddA [Pseudoramibacter alactolyticus]